MTHTKDTTPANPAQVTELPDDDAPKDWRDLAEAAIMDLRRYAYDETHHRRIVSAEAYEKRFRVLTAAIGAGSRLNMPTDPAWYEAKAKLEHGHEIGAGRRTTTINLTAEEISEMERLQFETLPKWAQDEITKLRSAIGAGGQAVAVKPLDPDMPAQEMRLHMGEMTAQEMRTARAAIRWANSAIAHPVQPGWRLVPEEPTDEMVQACFPNWPSDWRGRLARDTYTAMLSAAHQPKGE